MHGEKSSGKFCQRNRYNGRRIFIVVSGFAPRLEGDGEGVMLKMGLV